MCIAYLCSQNKTHITNRLMFQMVGGSLKFNSCQNFGCWQLKSAYMYIIHGYLYIIYTRRPNTKRGTNYLNRNLNTTVKLKFVDGGGIKLNNIIIYYVVYNMQYAIRRGDVPDYYCYYYYTPYSCL